jgi:hypothetical protein
MANEIVPYQMSKALQEIDRLRALIAWRCSRDDIREIHEPLPIAWILRGSLLPSSREPQPRDDDHGERYRKP